MMKLEFEKQNFLESVDIFGIGINIRFNKKAEHKTKIGGLITMVILFLMVYQIKLVIENLTDSKNPTVLFEQRYTQSPQRYDLQLDNFSFMFGLQDSKSQHFIDPAIYKVTLWSKKIQKVFDPKTGDYTTQWNNRIIETETCTKQHFQVKGAQEYFLKLKFSSMYCISLKEKDLYIEGQFDAMSYSGFQIIVESCAGESCKSSEQLQYFLNSGRMAIYYIDHTINPSDKDHPFQPLGRQSFWVSGPQFTKSMNISVRNTYLQTDVGIINQEIKEERTLTWSFDREQTIPKVGNILYDCYFSFEKNVNSVYKRGYVKFDRAISQIGGAFNVLFTIGCLICRPLSQLELNRKLINSIFNFEDNNDQSEKELNEQDCNILKEKEVQQNNNNNQHHHNHLHVPDQTQEEIRSERNKSIGARSKQSTLAKYSFNSQLINNFNKTLSNSQTFKQNESQNQERSKQNSRSASMKCEFMKSQEINHLQNKQFDSFFKRQINSIKFKGYEFLLNFFKLSDACRSRKERLLQKGVDKLYNHIDIFYLINKLLEVEKLKHILLNEDQIKLFEFIPNPTLCMSDKKPQLIPDKIGIHQENNKSLLEKTVDAHEYFKKIIRKEKTISKVDGRLLELLDPRFTSFLHELENNNSNNNTNSVLQNIATTLENNQLLQQQQQKQQNLAIGIDDSMMNIPMECSNSESKINLMDSVRKIMLTYKTKEPNIIKFPQLYQI